MFAASARVRLTASGRPMGASLLAAIVLGSALYGCGAAVPETMVPAGVQREALSCAVGCGGALGTAILPAPSGTVSLTAWSNSPQLGTYNDCDATACAGTTPNTAANGQKSYGCPWQCVELTNRYLMGTWGGHKIQANAGPSYCQYAASNSLPEYYVYGSYGVSSSGHAPIAGDVLVWDGHVAIATTSVAPGASGTLTVIEENATCSGFDSVSWNGSMFGAKYGLAPLCWVHVIANSGAGPTCPSGSNWHGAGDYCGSQPGMANASAGTLYSCGGAGGPAAVKQACAYGCQQMPAGYNDQCAAASGPTCPTGGSWNGAGDYCWDQPGMLNTAQDTLYSCTSEGGTATAKQTCALGCQHMPSGQNDQCAPLHANGAACARGTECASGDCVDGICCDSACGPCGTCTTGSCTPLARGSSDEPACDPFVCDGQVTSCPSSCADDSSCAALDYCDAGACVPTQPDGSACSASDQCASASCSAGVCATAESDGGVAPDAGEVTVAPDAGDSADAGVPPAANGAGVAGGCGAARSSSWAIAALALLALARRRRR